MRDEGQHVGLDSTRTSLGTDGLLRAGQVLAGRYRVEETVGVGAMGAVYRAQDERLGITVAIKILHSSISAEPEAMRRFETELTLARQVTHPNVVRIHDIVEHESLTFLTMDLVDGQPLSDLIASSGRLAPERAAKIAAGVAAGLAAAHAQGVVHRDLKPANILVDGDDNGYITDFGVARSIASARLTRTGFFVGTPDYLSPEQARGDTVDGRTDIYALGLILYEMLVGRPPFDAGSIDELVAQRTIGRLPNLTRQGLAAPEHLRRIIRRCLQRNAEDRYADAATLAGDLEHGVSPRRIRSWIPKLALTAALAAWAVIVMVRWLDTPATDTAEVAPPTSTLTLAVLPFVDRPDDPALSWIATGVGETLTADLADSRGLAVVDRQRVRTTLADLKIGTGRPDADVARQLAELFGADWLVGGRLAISDGDVEARIVLLSSSPSVTDRTVPPIRSRLEDVASLGTQIADAVREALSLPDAAQAPMRLSSDLDALRAYATGVDLLATGDSLGAVEPLEAAVRADAGFAAAWLKLAETYSALGRSEAATSAVNKAVEHSAGADSRIARMARVRQAAMTGKLDEAGTLLGQLVAADPGDGSARLMLAELTGDAGETAAAIEQLEALVADDPNHPRAWFLLGKFAIQSGDAQRALGEYLVNALSIQRKLNNLQGQAEVLNAMGIAQHRVGDLEAARASYSSAASIRADIGDKRGLASSLANLAWLELQIGRFDEARATLDRAIDVRSELGDLAGLAGLYNIYGVLEEEHADYRAALRRYRQALKIREETGDKRALGNSYNNIGFAYFVLGEYDNAGVYWQLALDQAVESGNPDTQMQAQQNLGQLKIAQGDWATALDLFLKSLGASREAGYPDAEAVALGNLGRVAQRQGRFVAALEYYAEALTIVDELGDARGQIEFTLFRAETLLEMGNVETARVDIDSAGALIDQSDNDAQRAVLGLLAGSIAALGGERSAADAAFAAALKAGGRTGSDVPVLRVLIAQAEVSKPGAVEDIDALSERVLEIGDADLSMRILTVLARDKLAGDLTDEAADIVRELLIVIAPHTPYSRAWRIHAVAADVLAAQGLDDGAASQREAARKEIDRLVNEMPDDARERFLAQPEIKSLLPI